MKYRICKNGLGKYRVEREEKLVFGLFWKIWLPMTKETSHGRGTPSFNADILFAFKRDAEKYIKNQKYIASTGPDKLDGALKNARKEHTWTCQGEF